MKNKISLISSIIIIITHATLISVYAKEYTWVGTTSSWTTPSNWSPATPVGGPNASDEITIPAVVAPAVAPIITTQIQISDLTINEGALLTISAEGQLTVTGDIDIKGGSSILGEGSVTLTSSKKLSIGDIAGVTTIAPEAVIQASKKPTFTNTTFSTATIEASDPTISGCTFTGAVSITMMDGKGVIEGPFTCNAACTIINQGSKAFEFGSKNLEVFTFNGDANFTTTASGEILLGNTSDDAFLFMSNVKFSKNGVGVIDVARFGTTEFHGSLTYNASPADDVTFGKEGGGLSVFKGGISQVIASNITNGFKLNKLTIDKTANHVTLNTPVSLVSVTKGPQTFQPQLSLINGNLITSNTTTPAQLITFPDNSVVVLNPNPVLSFIEGPARKIGATAFTFPIGKGTAYRPISISAPTPIPSPIESFAIVAEYFNVIPPSAASLNTDVPTLNNCEYWNLSRTQGTSNVAASVNVLPACEILQKMGMMFSVFNATTSKWQAVPSTLSPSDVLTSNTALAMYGNITTGYSARKIFVDTRGLVALNFAATGGNLPTGTTDQSNKVTTLFPATPVSGTSTITLDIEGTAEADPMKVTFDIDNLSNISNVKMSSASNPTTLLPLDAEFYSIDNASSNTKTIKFLLGDETAAPLFTTNLMDGTVMMNSTGGNFQIDGLASYTIASFKILSLSNTLVKGPLAVATWDGTDQNNAEVSNGIYKFELVITYNATDYTYNGQIIVK
jgi:hypothetical protein